MACIQGVPCTGIDGWTGQRQLRTPLFRWNSSSSTIHTAPLMFSTRTKHLWRLRLCLTAFCGENKKQNVNIRLMARSAVSLRCLTAPLWQTHYTDRGFLVRCVCQGFQYITSEMQQYILRMLYSMCLYMSNMMPQALLASRCSLLIILWHSFQGITFSSIFPVQSTQVYYIQATLFISQLILQCGGPQPAACKPHVARRLSAKPFAEVQKIVDTHL